MQDLNTTPETPDDLREYAIRGGFELDPVLREIYLRNCAPRERANAIDKAGAAAQIAEISR